MMPVALPLPVVTVRAAPSAVSNQPCLLKGSTTPPFAALAKSGLMAGEPPELKVASVAASPATIAMAQTRMRFPVTAATTVSLYDQWATEPELPVQGAFDRANVGLFDEVAGRRTTIVPDGGRTYNVSGPNGSCVTQGEPGSSTEILITQSYKYAFERYRYGYAAAYSTVIFMILLIYGWWQNRVTRATEGIA